MKRLTLTILAGVAAVAATGSALANTALLSGNPGPGSIFLEVIDSTNNTSFTFDTGLTMASFTGAAFSQNLASDANWQTFITGTAAGDTISWLVGGQNSASGPASAMDMTTSSLGGLTNSQLKSVSAANPFISAVNNTTSTTTNSIFAAQSTNSAAYGGSLSFGTALTNQVALNAMDTAVNFYNWVINGTLNLTQATATQFTGQWELTSAGLLTFSGGVAPVPLPPSLLLLLSGAVLTTMLARRRSAGGMVSAIGA
jgi:hypothetical protein